MTPLEIRDRLRTEFPGRHVSFEIEVNCYPSTVVADDYPDMPPVNMRLWESTAKSVECASLEDGIRAMKVRLGMAVPEMELTV